ncbi:MAG: hypothetical protein LBD55_08185 [Treponema sp.]|jgi:hypothetical protein|nr:hypothetical protein [Treponema sp.]
MAIKKSPGPSLQNRGQITIDYNYIHSLLNTKTVAHTMVYDYEGFGFTDTFMLIFSGMRKEICIW